MPTPKKSRTAAAKKLTPSTNKAKDAFAEYTQRMNAEFEKYTSRASEAAATADSLPQQPVAQPYPGMMPVFMLPQSPGMVPSPHVKREHSTVASDIKSNDPGDSLFHRLGNLLSLGVDVATAGLQGGLELIGGASAGQGACSCCPQPSHQYQACCSTCSDECCGCEQNNCYSSCCDDCCCNPGVHNCH